ncbi:hypothetical protein [Acetobacter sp. DsW_063]|uniref:hypothetical protein n=1 Tax=Acetobacter sp. DsW_063 TaxID=1514894 RepID=UPI000A37AD12|nr:hypothetical protein [Acetobacter sp. DsW_063]OUJ17071.1 hypothetical protein HK28_07840 [Acetobacter sp. DsW_063]
MTSGMLALSVVCAVIFIVVMLLAIFEFARHARLVERVKELEGDVKSSLHRIETTLESVRESGRNTTDMVRVIVQGHIERKSQ